MALIAMATGFILILIGLFGALSHRNILRMIVAFTVANTGNVTNTGSETTVLTTSVTTDGATDIEIMAKWRPAMREFYYDASRFDSYLEQLGIEYPTVKSRPISDDAQPEPAGSGKPQG